MNTTTLLKPLEILKGCAALQPSDKDYTEHPIIKKYGSPEQLIYIDKNTPTINGITYTDPLIVPIYNARLELIQCAIVQDGQPTMIHPDSLAKGFAYFGENITDKSQPIILTYSLETFFKVAQTGYNVVWVVLSKLRLAHETGLKQYEYHQIKFVIEQLEQAGYKRLYMPLYSRINEDFQQLECDTTIRLIPSYIQYGDETLFFEFNQGEPSEDVFVIKDSDSEEIQQLKEMVSLHTNDREYIKFYLDEAIRQLPTDKETPLPDGHLARPMYLDHGNQVHILETGLYLIKEKTGKDEEPSESKTFISQPVIILGEARSTNNDNWKRVIRFHDKDNIQHTLCIPYEHFMGDAQEALRTIANFGLMPPRQSNKKNVFIQYIQDYPIFKRFRCVDRIGWYGQAFVTPCKTYGQSQDEELLYHHEGKNPYSTKGTLEGWKELSRLIEPHVLGVLCFSCAFAGQLVEPLNIESGGFHIYGSSTDGKSTITQASCSVWGNPKEISKSWRTTDNALENEAELRNDSFLLLDELRQAVPKAVSDIIYMLTGGQGKARSSKTGKNRELKQFNLMYLSTGEITLEEHLRRGNIELDAGLLLRFAHLPSDAGQGLGIFDTLNYGKAAQDIANQINTLAAQHYGHAGIQWLEYLTKDKDTVITEAKRLFIHFINQQSENLNGQMSRVLRRFALVAVAGELATQAGITGWKSGRAFEALKVCFKQWVEHYGSHGNLEDQKILEHIKAFFEAHGNSRFESIEIRRNHIGEEIRPRISHQVGYFDPDNNMYLVSTTMFKKEMCLGFNETKAKKVLKANGWIDCEDGRYTKRLSHTLPDGTRPTLMHFRADRIRHYNLDT